MRISFAHMTLSSTWLVRLGARAFSALASGAGALIQPDIVFSRNRERTGKKGNVYKKIGVSESSSEVKNW